jgi:hypothetical protein
VAADRRLWRSWAPLLLLGSATLFLIARTPIGWSDGQEASDSERTARHRVDRARPPDATVLHGVELRQVIAGGGRADLGASELRFEKRLGMRGTLVYQDAREVVLTSVHFRLQLGEGIPLSFPLIPREIARMLGNEERMDFGVKPSLLNGVVADAPGAFLSRVRFQDLSIDLLTPAGERVAIQARQGRFHPTTETLVLGGGVEVLSPDGARLDTGQAIVSSDLSGLYLPLSHRREDRVVESRSLVTLEPSGSIAVALGPEPQSALDPIEQLERIVFAKYVDELPAPVRAVLFPGSRPQIGAD